MRGELPVDRAPASRDPVTMATPGENIGGAKFGKTRA